jgi:hypothetical protein
LLVKDGGRGDDYLLSCLLLLCAVAKVELVAAALGCVCGQRYVDPVKSGVAIEIENNDK